MHLTFVNYYIALSATVIFIHVDGVGWLICSLVVVAGAVFLIVSINLNYVLSCRSRRPSAAAVSESPSTTSSTAEGEIKLLLLCCIFFVLEYSFTSVA